MAEIVFSGDPLEVAARAQDWIAGHLLTPAALAQAVAVALLCLAGLALGRALKRALTPAPGKDGWRADPRVAPLLFELPKSAPAASCGILLLLADAVARRTGLPHQVLSIAAAGALAWVVAHLAGALIKSRFLGRLAAALVWVLAVLHALGVVEQSLAFLDSLGFTLGGGRLSLLTLMKSAALFAVLMQAARLLAGMADDRLTHADGLSPSAQALFTKGARFGLYALAVTIALSAAGVDLTSLTVFSGAVGVGVGFGLQKIFSNLVSGVILLVDKSLKPGDVIEMGGVQGRIAQINARYTAVETLDGKAHLIPNESLITNEVVNLSYSDSHLRVHAKVGVAYGTDPRLAMRLMEEAAATVPRVQAEPEPRANLAAFGDSAMDLDLAFWIADPENGVPAARSDVLLAIHDAFVKHGVAIPFPQREVRIVRD